MNRDFASKDTSLYSSGICTVLIASIKFSTDYSLRRDYFVCKGLQYGRQVPRQLIRRGPTAIYYMLHRYTRFVQFR